MAQDRQDTPEKQLLKLIEGAKNQEQHKPLEKLGLKNRRFLSRLSFQAVRGALAGRLSFFKRTTRKKIGSTKWVFSFAVANKMLLGLTACSAVYLVGDTMVSAVDLGRSSNFAFQKDKTFVGTAPGVSFLKEESYYLNKIAERDLFSEFVKSQAKERIAEPESVEAIKNLSLVGISWSANPDVIIEDKVKQRTYFLKRGKTIDGGVKVETVFKDKVVLSYGGMEFELK